MMIEFDETRFFKNPANMTDAELEREIQHLKSGRIERELLDAESVSPLMKDTIREYMREVEQEKSKRDEMIYPINEFLGFPGF